MTSLNNVTTLHLPIPFFFPDDEEAHDSLVYDYAMPLVADTVFVNILDVMSSKLQSLRITGAHIRNVPIRILSSLTDLEIHATEGSIEELMGLDVIFRHASLLESLSLVGLFVPELFSFFSTSSEIAFPNLTSFRLSCDSDMVDLIVGEDEVGALARFLNDHLLLRRLYVRLPTVSWAHVGQLLCAIPQLKRLEVLGFHTGHEALSNPAVLESLSQCLSPQLRALHIAINWFGGNILPLVYYFILISMIVH